MCRSAVLQALGRASRELRRIRGAVLAFERAASDYLNDRNAASMSPSSENLSSGISVFAAVVDAGTFAAASELMSMSPPGVSRAIARLERRLKIRLFNRTTRAVSLTEEGRRFYEQVMPHLRGMEEAAA